MSPIGRPHNPAATSGPASRPGPLDEAPATEADQPDAPPAVETAEGGEEPFIAAAPGGADHAGAESAEAGSDEPVPDEPPSAESSASLDGVAGELAAVRAERDEYLELARAKQAELENFRKQVMKRQADHLQQAAADIVTKLLPVLDALDNGVSHGDESLVPVRAQLLGVLEKDGLRRVDPAGFPFDPNEHEAVAHEPGDGGEATVAETLRAGYWWNGRLLRAAMVRVRG